MPQFAYAKHRGTADAIAKANRFQQQAGLRSRQCANQVPQDVITIVQQLHKDAGNIRRAHTFMKANLPLPGWQLQHALQVHHKRPWSSSINKQAA